MTALDRISTARDDWLGVLRRDDDAVAREAEARLATCGEALALVQERLRTIGYPVRTIVRPLDRARLDEVDRRLADAHLVVPPLLRTLWDVVGAVSVLDLSRYSHVSFWGDRLGTERYTDGLHIESPGEGGGDDEAYVDHVVQERLCWLDSGWAAEVAPFDWPMAPDDLHKDNVSGGAPYELRAGTSTWDHRVVNLSWRGGPATAPDGDPDLLSYLRTAVLECGCFPGLLGHPAFEPDRLHLTEGLPIF